MLLQISGGGSCAIGNKCLIELFSRWLVPGQHLCESLDFCLMLVISCFSRWLLEIQAWDVNIPRSKIWEREKDVVRCIHSFSQQKVPSSAGESCKCVISHKCVHHVNTMSFQGGCKSNHSTRHRDTPNKTKVQSKKGEMDIDNVTNSI